jgi:hypothetical protein
MLARMRTARAIEAPIPLLMGGVLLLVLVVVTLVAGCGSNSTSSTAPAAATATTLAGYAGASPTRSTTS